MVGGPRVWARTLPDPVPEPGPSAEECSASRSSGASCVPLVERAPRSKATTEAQKKFTRVGRSKRSHRFERPAGSPARTNVELTGEVRLTLSDVQIFVVAERGGRSKCFGHVPDGCAGHEWNTWSSRVCRDQRSPSDLGKATFVR